MNATCLPLGAGGFVPAMPLLPPASPAPASTPLGEKVQGPPDGLYWKASQRSGPTLGDSKLASATFTDAPASFTPSVAKGNGRVPPSSLAEAAWTCGRFWVTT